MSCYFLKNFVFIFGRAHFSGAKLIVLTEQRSQGSNFR